MRRVTFEVAKAIKEAGYPQGNNNAHYVDYEGDVCFHDWAEAECAKWTNFFAAPYYFEVWEWLWGKDTWIITLGCSWTGKARARIVIDGDDVDFSGCNPEEAIASAIDYLVEFNLIRS